MAHVCQRGVNRSAADGQRIAIPSLQERRFHSQPCHLTLAKASPARGCAVAVPRLGDVALASFTTSAGPTLVVICTWQSVGWQECGCMFRGTVPGGGHSGTLASIVGVAQRGCSQPAVIIALGSGTRLNNVDSSDNLAVLLHTRCCDVVLQQRSTGAAGGAGMVSDTHCGCPVLGATQ